MGAATRTIGCALLAFGYGGIANMTSFQHFVTAIMTVEPIGPRWMDVNNATLQQQQAANSMDMLRDVLMRRRVEAVSGAGADVRQRELHFRYLLGVSPRVFCPGV